MNAFSYPFGYPDSINDQVINLVQEAGYAAAFTAQKGIFRPGDSLFTLPRIRMLPNKVNINSFETSSLAQAIDELLLVAFGAEERLAHYNN